MRQAVSKAMCSCHGQLVSLVQGCVLLLGCNLLQHAQQAPATSTHSWFQHFFRPADLRINLLAHVGLFQACSRQTQRHKVALAARRCIMLPQPSLRVVASETPVLRSGRLQSCVSPGEASLNLPALFPSLELAEDAFS